MAPRNSFDDPSDQLKRPTPLWRKVVLGATAGVVALLGLTVMFGSWFTVDTGFVGVVYRNGAIVSVEQPGLHFKLPMIETVAHVKTMTTKITYENVNAMTSDQQNSYSKITAIWHLDPNMVKNLISTAGTEYWTTLITPVVPTQYKAIINGNDVVHIILNRDSMAEKTMASVSGKLAARGIILEEVKLENIDFSKEYQRAVETAMQARADVQRAEQELAKQKVEAEKTVVNAKANAEAAIEKARGEAEATRQKAIAEAAALQLVGEALARNPKLVDKLAIEKWNGSVPVTMVPGSAVPFVNINQSAPAPR